MFGWDAHGTIIFNDVICKDNTVTEDGGCFHGWGGGIFNNGTALLGNVANNGACICERTKYVNQIPLVTVSLLSSACLSQGTCGDGTELEYVTRNASKSRPTSDSRRT